MSSLISKIEEISIQEIIEPTDCVYKGYSAFGNSYIRINNTIEISGIKDPGLVKKEDTKKVVVNEIDQQTKSINDIVISKLNAGGYVNFGLDFVRKTGTNEYYFFDLNSDTIIWAKLFKNQEREAFIKGNLSLLDHK